MSVNGRTPAGRASVSTVRVRYAETDKMGVVYYANYLVWFEVGRADLLRSLGWTYREMETDGISLPVIEAHCEYLRPARYDDEIEVRTHGVRISDREGGRPVGRRIGTDRTRVAGSVGTSLPAAGPHP
jgi:acyl-CoA thioester hydrolase